MIVTAPRLAIPVDSFERAFALARSRPEEVGERSRSGPRAPLSASAFQSYGVYSLADRKKAMPSSASGKIGRRYPRLDPSSPPSPYAKSSNMISVMLGLPPAHMSLHPTSLRLRRSDAPTRNAYVFNYALERSSVDTATDEDVVDMQMSRSASGDSESQG